jgi:peptidoglycan hydrolase-like protein with peptidoglycan-binding domain
MFRALTLASALMAASLSANTLAAQSSSTASSKPAMHQAPAVKTDTSVRTGTSTSGVTKPGAGHRTAWTPAQVKEAQEGLAKAGLYKGKATGVLNKDTRRALRAYQKENHLPVTGRLNDSTLAKLKSA